MKYTLPLLTLAFLILVTSCKPKEVRDNTTIEVLEEFSELQAIMDSGDHDLLVLNFWSTACAPCIKEMPHFNQLQSEYKDKKVRVLLVSLEPVTNLEKRIYPYVKKYNIVPEVKVLKDQNYTIWTEKIDASWYGALPATLILKGEERTFRFGSYKTYEELQTDVETLITK